MQRCLDASRASTHVSTSRRAPSSGSPPNRTHPGTRRAPRRSGVRRIPVRRPRGHAVRAGLWVGALPTARRPTHRPDVSARALRAAGLGMTKMGVRQETPIDICAGWVAGGTADVGTTEQGPPLDLGPVASGITRDDDALGMARLRTAATAFHAAPPSRRHMAGQRHRRSGLLLPGQLRRRRWSRDGGAPVPRARHRRSRNVALHHLRGRSGPTPLSGMPQRSSPVRSGLRAPMSEAYDARFARPSSGRRRARTSTTRCARWRTSPR